MARSSPFWSSALFSLACLCAAPDAHAAMPQDWISGRAVIYLGSIAIDGERRVYEALQDIKVALEQPLSSDPRFADVMVCRLADEIGKRAKQVLICGSNRALAQNRELMQTVVAAGLICNRDCGDRPGPGQVVGVLNDSINSQPRLYLMQQVNGPSLEALLATIPYPAINSGSPKPAPWLPRAPSPSICGDMSPDAQPAARSSPRLTDCLAPAA